MQLTMENGMRNLVKILSVLSLLLLTAANSALAQIEFRGIYLGMGAYEAFSIASKISDIMENDSGFVFTAPIKLVNTKISVNIYDNKVNSFELFFDKRHFAVIKESLVEKYGNEKYCSFETNTSSSSASYSYEICIWKLQDGAVYLNEKNPYNGMESLLVIEPLKGRGKRQKSFWSNLGLW